MTTTTTETATPAGLDVGVAAKGGAGEVIRFVVAVSSCCSTSS